MLPAFPVPVVEVVMITPSATVRFWVLRLMLPACPLPEVSAVIEPNPRISMVSGAVMVMLPPSPILVVRAEMKPFSEKLMLRLGVSRG